MIKQQTGVDALLERGGGGQFDVLVDGQILFSKHKEGRFPDEAEILARLASLAAG